MKSPLDMFFAIGNKLEPKSQAKFTYYLLWIVFLTFFSMSMGYFVQFFKTGNLMLVGWGVLMLIFSYFNYINLSSTRNSINANNMPKQEEKIENKEEMLNDFKK